MNNITKIIMNDIGNPELTEKEKRDIGKIAVNTVLFGDTMIGNEDAA
jgi:hypothetical protein